MARRTVPPEIKAKAMADLLAGDQPAVVAEHYDLPGGTVRQWKNRLVTPDVTESVTPPVTKHPHGRPIFLRQPRREAAELTIAELVMENLRAKLTATQGIVEYVTNNPAWLEKQTAADVGDLFERIDRSSIAMLDRMAAAGRPAATGGDENPPGAD